MPNSPDQLCETWMALLTDPEKLAQLSRDAHEGTKARFNIHNHANEIIALYERVHNGIAITSEENTDVVTA
jgi:hypothetical protein